MMQADSIRTVAVIDDDISSAEGEVLLLEDAGFQPFIVDQRYASSVATLTSYIRDNSDGAICDHRLQHGKFANFYGAELVASLYSNRFPAVLVTQFKEQDYDVSIRRWREHVPVVLSRDQLNEHALRFSLLTCQQEIIHGMPNRRKPRSTILRVEDVNLEAGEGVIDVIVPGWNVKRAVRLPLSLVPIELHKIVKTGVRLVADVNIDSETNDELFFRNVRLAMEVDSDDGLA